MFKIVWQMHERALKFHIFKLGIRWGQWIEHAQRPSAV